MIAPAKTCANCANYPCRKISILLNCIRDYNIDIRLAFNGCEEHVDAYTYSPDEV